MHNKYESCYGCPDHSMTCRAGCEGWQFRESEKPARYARNAIHSQNYDTYSKPKEMLMRKKKVLMKGYGQ